MAGMPEDPSAAAICRLLATPERLKVVAALALGAGTLAEVAELAGLDRRAAGQVLARLGTGGLVESGRDGGYRLRTEALAAAGQSERVEPAQTGDDFPGADPESAKVLRRFISDGRLIQLPAPRGKRRVVLEYLAGVFEPGRRYEEREVNAILGAIHPDHATLRRYLVDEGFMDREHGQYWRSGGSVQVD
jgi:hypothetical protein